MKNKPLVVYLIILAVLCASFIIGMKMLGQQGVMLAQFYMLTPALAAFATRLFFYKNRFKDANLRFGKLEDYFKYWSMALAITILSYVFYTLLGSISWDLTGNSFLEKLTKQFAETGQDINATLPPGFTPKLMLWIFFIGGLTVFNLFPGIITGFGEEFGHRGFMFPLLYKIKPLIGFIIGGLIWYGWHLPLTFVLPQATDYSLWQTVVNYLIMAVGAICTFTFLAYVYVKSESVFVTSIAHITMNNSATSLSYFVVLRDQILANLGLALTMIVVVVILYFKAELGIFGNYFSKTT